MNDEVLLSYEQAALLLNIRVATLYSKVSRREVPFFRLGGRLVRFSPSRLREWLEAHHVAPRDSTEAVPRLDDQSHEKGRER